MCPADFPLVLKRDKPNTFALALSRKTRQRQSRGEVGRGTLVSLIKPKERKVCGAQREQLTWIQEARYK